MSHLRFVSVIYMNTGKGGANMKQTLFLLMIFLSASVYGETLGDSLGFPFNEEKQSKSESETETLFGSGEVDISGFGGPYMTTGTINNEQVYFSGIRGAAIFNRSYLLGLAGCALEYPHDRGKLSGRDYQGDYTYMQVQYGGLFTGWNFDQQDVVHMSFTSVIGGGKLFYTDVEEQEDDFGSHTDKQSGTEEFFVIEPALMMHINITRWMRFGGGLSYRYTKGIDNGEISDKDLSDWSVQFALDFGWF